MEQIRCKVLVVGGGPGGYVAAIRAGQLGLDTVLVEAGKLGGTCLIRGCIPSKALIHVADKLHAMATHAEAAKLGIKLSQAPEFDLAGAVHWKDEVVGKLNTGVAGLLKRAKVRVVSGWATFSDAKTCTVEGDKPVTIIAEHVILANGSVPAALAHLPFGGNVISSTEALSLNTLPKHLVVVGAGYIGLELGIAFRKMGAHVAVVEAQNRILPQYDAALSAPVKQSLEKLNIPLYLNAKAQKLADKKKGLIVETADGKTVTLPADKILVTVGRRPNTLGWGLENMCMDMAGPFIKVDDQCRTAMKNVWAIGDLVGEPMLAHKASAQGEMVAEIIAGKRCKFAPIAIPAVCFTDPEIVTVGLSPDAVKAQKTDVITGIFPLAANGRALSMEAASSGGFVRVMARADDHRILGIDAVGPHVSELSGEFSLALEMGAVLEDIAGVIHAHPTLSESFHEAALKTLGHAIHI